MMEHSSKPVHVESNDDDLVARVAAIDVAKDSGMACTRVPDESRPGKRTTTVWSVRARTSSIIELADQLAEQRIERVVLEATSDYWRPFYYLLEARGLTVWLVNALLEARSPAPGEPVLITNQAHDGLTADLRDTEADLDATQEAHWKVPARLPLSQVNPGQQVLDIQTKLMTHAIRMTAFNTATALARALRVHTGYARANHEAHTLARQALTGSGDIDPGYGVLTVRLDPLPTGRGTTAIRELCQHLTATETRYPGTDLVLRYEIKTRP